VGSLKKDNQISVKIARDMYGVGFRIMPVDEGNAPLDFKIMVGLEEEINSTKTQKNPIFNIIISID